jgi:hypothetical protein
MLNSFKKDKIKMVIDRENMIVILVLYPNPNSNTLKKKCDHAIDNNLNII